MVKSTSALLADVLPPRVSIIGGGGKTTLMLSLGRELARRGHSVLLTTTTHLAWPPPAQFAFSSPADLAELNAQAAAGKAILAGYPCGNGRMIGVPEAFFQGARFDYILCEADGSARLPLKVHKDTEPVIPSGTQMVIQVAGLSALGQPIGEAVHRYALMDLDPQEPVSPHLMARILAQGWQHINWQGQAVTLLNQADDELRRRLGGEVAKLLIGDVMICALEGETERRQARSGFEAS
jgi:probable selenium-dependent hydroxylase accessory protein YqeC